MGQLLQQFSYLVENNIYPDIINISPDDIAKANISLSDFTSTIRTMEQIHSKNVSQRPPKADLMYRASSTINYREIKKIESSGFTGISPMSTVHGIDGVIDAAHQLKCGNFCPDFLKDDFKPNSIDINQLTLRQQQVIHFISHRGLSNKQIARQLGISESAVKLHVGILLNKFGVRNRTELALVYTEVQPRLLSDTFKVA